MVIAIFSVRLYILAFIALVVYIYIQLFYYFFTYLLNYTHGREPEAPCKYPLSTKQSIQRTGFVVVNDFTLTIFILVS